MSTLKNVGNQKNSIRLKHREEWKGKISLYFDHENSKIPWREVIIYGTKIKEWANGNSLKIDGKSVQFVEAISINLMAPESFFFNFCTPCILNVNNTGTKYIRIMKQTAF